MTAINLPPANDELEITLFGPGYGESIALHTGNGAWVLVDSCIDPAGEPRSLQYLNDLGVDPARDVRLIVTTHWHDDHIRGMAKLVSTCGNAAFCCAIVLSKQEFLKIVGTWGPDRMPGASSGVRELRRVFEQHKAAAKKPTFAIADRRIYVQDACEIWSLSPNDKEFVSFLGEVGSLIPGQGQPKGRIPSITPNRVAVVLWIRIGDAVLLLGSDMEKPGWAGILSSTARPPDRASVFKIPHHGSANADEPGVWRDMLETDPWAVLAPWRRGGRTLPRSSDVQRISSRTPNAYVTAQGSRLVGTPARRDRMVDKTIRDFRIRIRPVSMSSDAVRLRRTVGSQAPWRIELLGSACALKNFSP